MAAASMVLALLLSLPPSSGWGEDKADGTVKEKATIGLTAGAEIYSATGVAVDRRGNVYVSDLLEYCVKKFDARGRLAGRTGRRGTGAGEFTTPSTSLVWKDTLLVMQMNDARIQAFSTDLGYITSFTVEGGHPADMAVGPGGELVVATFDEEQDEQALNVYPCVRGGSPRRIPLGPTGKTHRLYGACRVGVCPDGTIVVAYIFMNRVDLYSREGRLRRRLKAPGIRELNEDARRLPEETCFRGVATDRRGNILLLGGSRARHGHADVLVYDAAGGYIRTITLPQKTRLIALDHQGGMYATAGEGMLVRRYEWVPVGTH